MSTRHRVTQRERVRTVGAPDCSVRRTPTSVDERPWTVPPSNPVKHGRNTGARPRGTGATSAQDFPSCPNDGRGRPSDTAADAFPSASCKCVSCGRVGTRFNDGRGRPSDTAADAFPSASCKCVSCGRVGTLPQRRTWASVGHRGRRVSQCVLQVRLVWSDWYPLQRRTWASVGHRAMAA